MKIAVSCDGIISRDYYLEIIEAILDQIGEQAELYTLIHNQGAVLGHVEMRKIHATGLTSKVQTWGGLLENSFLIPSVAKGLFIPCTYDLIINISRGFSTGFKKCEKTKLLTFLVEDINRLNRDRSFKEKIFQPLVKNYQKKSLAITDILWTSDISLVPESLQDKARVVFPPVKLNDYKILPDSMITNDYFLVNAESVDEETALQLIKHYASRRVKFKFIGRDGHLNDIKVTNEKFFFGDKCSGELAPLLGGAKYVIDFEENKLPIMALKAMACGRPVLSPGNKFIDFGEGFYCLSKEYEDSLFDVPEYDSKKIRGRSLMYDELKFKHILRRELESMEKESAPYNVTQFN